MCGDCAAAAAASVLREGDASEFVDSPESRLPRAFVEDEKIGKDDDDVTNNAVSTPFPQIDRSTNNGTTHRENKEVEEDDDKEESCLLGSQTGTEESFLAVENESTNTEPSPGSDALITGGPQSMFVVVTETLDGFGLTYQQVNREEQPNISLFQFRMTGKHMDYTAIISVDLDDEMLALYWTCQQVKIVPHRRSQVSRLLAVINYSHSAMGGHFDLDWRDGEIRFKVAQSVRGMRPSQEMVRHMVSVALTTFDRFFPAIMACQFGGKTAEQALAGIVECGSTGDPISSDGTNTGSDSGPDPGVVVDSKLSGVTIDPVGQTWQPPRVQEQEEEIGRFHKDPLGNTATAMRNRQQTTTMESEAELRFFKGALLNRPFRKSLAGSWPLVIRIKELGVRFVAFDSNDDCYLATGEQGKVLRTLYQNQADGGDDDYFWLDFKFAMGALGFKLPERVQQEIQSNVDEAKKNKEERKAGGQLVLTQEDAAREVLERKNDSDGHGPTSRAPVYHIKGKMNFEDEYESDDETSTNQTMDRVLLVFDTAARTGTAVFLVVSETSATLPRNAGLVLRALEVPCLLHIVDSTLKFLNMGGPELLSPSTTNRLLRPKSGRIRQILDEETKKIRVFSDDNQVSEGLNECLEENVNKGTLPFCVRYVWKSPWQSQVGLVFCGHIFMPWNVFNTILNTLHPCSPENMATETRCVVFVNLFLNSVVFVMSESSPTPRLIAETLEVYPYFMMITSEAVQRFRNNLTDNEREFVRAKWLHSYDGNFQVSVDYGPMVMCRRLVESQALEMMDQLGSSHITYFDPNTLSKTLFYKQEFLRTREGVACISGSSEETAFCQDGDSTSIFVAMEMGDFMEMGEFRSYRKCQESGLLKSVDDFDVILFISHPWETAEHPDPEGDMYTRTVERVRKYTGDAESGNLALITRSFGPFLNGALGDRAPRATRVIGNTRYDSRIGWRVGVFVDWSCLPQKPRTADEDKLFKDSLMRLADLLCSQHTNLVSVYKDKSAYLARSWCACEWWMGSSGGGSYEDDTSIDALLDNDSEVTEEMRATCLSILGETYSDLEDTVVDGIARALLHTKVTNQKDSTIIYRLMAEYFLRSRATWSSVCEESDSFMPV